MKYIKDYIDEKVVIYCENYQQAKFIDEEIVKCGGRSLIHCFDYSENRIFFELTDLSQKLNCYCSISKTESMSNNYYTNEMKGYTIFHANEFKLSLCEKIDNLLNKLEKL